MAELSTAFLDEAVFGTARMAYGLFDQDGRPLGELGQLLGEPVDDGDADLAANDPAADDDDDDEQDDVVFELAPAPYPGSRRGRDMNISALRQVNAHWDDVLADLNWLRDDYLARVAPPALTVFHLDRIAELATGIPAWLSRRGDPIPVRVAAQFKVSQGIGMTCRGLIAAGRGDDQMAAAELAAEAEQRGLLVRGDRACAGAPHLIETLFRVGLEGQSMPACSPLADHLGEPGRFVDYVFAARGLFRLSNALRAQLLPELGRARDAIGALPVILSPATVADLIEGAARELSWLGIDPTPVRAASIEPAPRDVDALAARLSPAGEGARDLARALLAKERLAAGVGHTLLTLTARMAHAIGTSPPPRPPDLFLELGAAVERLRRLGITPPWHTF